MNTYVGAALLTSLAMSPPLLISCSKSQAPSAELNRRAGVLRSATLPGDARLVEQYPTRATGAGYETSWQVETKLGWSEFSRIVQQAVGRHMRVKRSGDGHLVLRESLPGDVYTLDLRQQPGTEDWKTVLVTFSADAW